uniref:10 kDa heat shock protein, mitochondrial n=1 Tax=Otolemur garnettii TaxID=30611 RepID=H0XTD2_OTOGA
IMKQAFRNFPLLLVERSPQETVTTGGTMLPEKTSPRKVLSSAVEAVGLGSKGKDGEILPISVKVGDKVLPEYGDTKVVTDDKDYLLRDGDILGKNVN